MMPAPFDWIEIPAAKVTLNSNDGLDQVTTLIAAFSIAKYPVTNAQYAKFIEADGYNERN